MWPFRKTKWVVVKQEIQPSKFEQMAAEGVYPKSGSPWLLKKAVLIHYRDEISGNEKVESITL